MKKSNAVRQFHVSKCPDCGYVDGSIEITKAYDATRDLSQWADENRNVTIYTQAKPGQFLEWCRCDMLDQTEEEED